MLPGPKKDFDKALKHIQSAIEIHPRCENGHLLRGRIYYHQKKYKEALDDFNISLEHKPEDVESLRFKEICEGKLNLLRGVSPKKQSQQLSNPVSTIPPLPGRPPPPPPQKVSDNRGTGATTKLSTIPSLPPFRNPSYKHHQEQDTFRHEKHSNFNRNTAYHREGSLIQKGNRFRNDKTWQRSAHLRSSHQFSPDQSRPVSVDPNIEEDHNSLSHRSVPVGDDVVHTDDGNPELLQPSNQLSGADSEPPSSVRTHSVSSHDSRNSKSEQHSYLEPGRYIQSGEMNIPRQHSGKGSPNSFRDREGPSRLHHDLSERGVSKEQDKGKSGWVDEGDERYMSQDINIDQRSSNEPRQGYRNMHRERKAFNSNYPSHGNRSFPENQLQSHRHQYQYDQRNQRTQNNRPFSSNPSQSQFHPRNQFEHVEQYSRSHSYRHESQHPRYRPYNSRQEDSEQVGNHSRRQRSPYGKGYEDNNSRFRKGWDKNRPYRDREYGNDSRARPHFNDGGQGNSNARKMDFNPDDLIMVSSTGERSRFRMPKELQQHLQRDGSIGNRPPQPYANAYSQSNPQIPWPQAASVVTSTAATSLPPQQTPWPVDNSQSSISQPTITSVSQAPSQPNLLPATLAADALIRTIAGASALQLLIPPSESETQSVSNLLQTMTHNSSSSLATTAEPITTASLLQSLAQSQVVPQSAPALSQPTVEPSTTASLVSALLNPDTIINLVSALTSNDSVSVHASQPLQLPLLDPITTSRPIDFRPFQQPIAPSTNTNRTQRQPKPKRRQKKFQSQEQNHEQIPRLPQSKNDSKGNETTSKDEHLSDAELYKTDPSDTLSSNPNAVTKAATATISATSQEKEARDGTDYLYGSPDKLESAVKNTASPPIDKTVFKKRRLMETSTSGLKTPTHVSSTSSKFSAQFSGSPSATTDCSSPKTPDWMQIKEHPTKRKFESLRLLKTNIDDAESGVTGRQELQSDVGSKRPAKENDSSAAVNPSNQVTLEAQSDDKTNHNIELIEKLPQSLSKDENLSKTQTSIPSHPLNPPIQSVFDNDDLSDSSLSPPPDSDDFSDDEADSFFDKIPKSGEPNATKFNQNTTSAKRPTPTEQNYSTDAKSTPQSKVPAPSKLAPELFSPVSSLSDIDSPRRDDSDDIPSTKFDNDTHSQSENSKSDSDFVNRKDQRRRASATAVFVEIPTRTIRRPSSVTSQIDMKVKDESTSADVILGKRKDTDSHSPKRDDDNFVTRKRGKCFDDMEKQNPSNSARKLSETVSDTVISQQEKSDNHSPKRDENSVTRKDGKCSDDMVKQNLSNSARKLSETVSDTLTSQQEKSSLGVSTSTSTLSPISGDSEKKGETAPQSSTSSDVPRPHKRLHSESQNSLPPSKHIKTVHPASSSMNVQIQGSLSQSEPPAQSARPLDNSSSSSDGISKSNDASSISLPPIPNQSSSSSNSSSSIPSQTTTTSNESTSSTVSTSTTSTTKTRITDRSGMRKELVFGKPISGRGFLSRQLKRKQ
ncbi:hypothetical protein BKA69DRAFT_330583 [Paraphysoderma sedebokerense]|nr:hypothetical protein BKA69DRAFT_330583 [Paraphysoderma sedebokerense]